MRRHERRPVYMYVRMYHGRLCARIGHARYVHLSAGELLREERASGSSDGQLIDEYIREGRIVPVAISLGLLRKAMQASGPHARFLIDGFPRNSDNVEASKREAQHSRRRVNGPFAWFPSSVYIRSTYCFIALQ